MNRKKIRILDDEYLHDLDIQTKYYGYELIEYYRTLRNRYNAQVKRNLNLEKKIGRLMAKLDEYYEMGD